MSADVLATPEVRQSKPGAISSKIVLGALCAASAVGIAAWLTTSQGSDAPTVRATARSPQAVEEPQAPELAIPERYVGPNGATFGRMPADAATMNPEEFYAAMPDYLAVLDRGGTSVPGFVKKADLYLVLGTEDGRVTQYVPNPSESIPVYAEDGETVVGQWWHQKGFIAPDEDPAAVPDSGEVVTKP